MGKVQFKLIDNTTSHIWNFIFKSFATHSMTRASDGKGAKYGSSRPHQWNADCMQSLCTLIDIKCVAAFTDRIKFFKQCCLSCDCFISCCRQAMVINNSANLIFW